MTKLGAFFFLSVLTFLAIYRAYQINFLDHRGSSSKAIGLQIRHPNLFKETLVQNDGRLLKIIQDKYLRAPSDVSIEVVRLA